MSVYEAITKLSGVISGVMIDGELTDAEIVALKNYMHRYGCYLRKEPFSALRQQIDMVLKDGVITEDERDEIIVFCEKILNENELPDDLYSAYNIALGVIKGVMIDGEINRNEAEGLADWLLEYECFQREWPFAVIWHRMLLLKNAGLSVQSLQETRVFLERFIDFFYDRKKIDYKFCDKPSFVSLASTEIPALEICDPVSQISFAGSLFCFTGLEAKSTRGKYWDAAKLLGGLAKSAVTRDLNYLVIGSYSPKSWRYGTYGSKVAEALCLRRSGSGILIVSEDLFYSESVRMGFKYGKVYRVKK